MHSVCKLVPGELELKRSLTDACLKGFFGTRWMGIAKLEKYNIFSYLSHNMVSTVRFLYMGLPQNEP